MNIQKVLKRLESISESVCGTSEKFNETLQEIIVTKSHSTNDNKRGYLRNLFSNIESNAQIIVDNTHKDLQVHLQTVKEKQLSVNQLNDVLEQLREEYENDSQIIEMFRKKTETLEQQFDELQSLKDVVKTYKLMTGTNFVYKKITTSTAGYIKEKNFPNFETFDFDNSQVNENEIRKKIWMLLQSVSERDYKNKSVEKLDNNKKIIVS